MRQRGLALVLCLALFAPAAARAEGSTLVTVVRPKDAGELVGEAVTRLSAELTAAGFSVHVVEGTPGAGGRVQVEGASGAAATDKGGKGSGSFATIAILETDRGAVADVWVADHVTQKTLVRRVDVGAPAIDNAASDLAVRSVELLRASLLEVSAEQKRQLPAPLSKWLDRTAEKRPAPSRSSPSSAPPQPAETKARSTAPEPASASPPDPSPKAPARASAKAPARRGGPSFEVDFSVLASRFGATPRPLLRIAYELPIGLAARASLSPSISSNTRSAPGGSVSLQQTVGWLDVAYVFRVERARLYPSLSLGAGIYRLRVDGRGDRPYQGEIHDLFYAALLGGVGLGVRIMENLMARAALDMLVSVPEPAVTILDVEVGRAGLPVFLPSVGLCATFF